MVGSWMVWRHPRPRCIEGRCIGQTDVPVDRRKIKRLAHRIRQAARRHGWPHIIYTSPLQRGAKVGQQLKKWGWQHHVDARIQEMDFGDWDGRPWAEIAPQHIQQWCAAFATYAPGGGESLQAFLARAWSSLEPAEPVRLMVGHAGWMSAMTWMTAHDHLPLTAVDWPASPRYGELRVFDVGAVQYRPTTPASFK